MLIVWRAIRPLLQRRGHMRGNAKRLENGSRWMRVSRVSRLLIVADLGPVMHVSSRKLVTVRRNIFILRGYRIYSRGGLVEAVMEM